MKFNLSVEEISKQYFAQILKSHPDKSQSSISQIDKNNIDDAGAINQAYFELKDPLKRAIHLLSIQNFTLAENIKHSHESGDFLMEKMQLYEKLDAINQAKNLQNLKIFQNNLKDKLQTLFANLESDFKNNQLLEVQKKIIACQFYQQILDKSQNLSFLESQSDQNPPLKTA